jgi:hypothetical protein
MNDELSMEQVFKRIFGAEIKVILGHPEDYLDSDLPLSEWLYRWLAEVAYLPPSAGTGAVNIAAQTVDRWRVQNSEAVDAAVARLLEEHGVRVVVGDD